MISILPFAGPPESDIAKEVGLQRPRLSLTGSFTDSEDTRDALKWSSSCPKFLSSEPSSDNTLASYI